MRRRSSTASTTWRPECGAPARHDARAPPGEVEADCAEATPLPWWEPAVDAAVDPWTDTVLVGGVEVGTGTSVRLHPSRRADAHDMFFDGQVATVAGVFHDVDGEMHVAVTLDDDPGDRGAARGTAGTCTSIPTKSSVRRR